MKKKPSPTIYPKFNVPAAPDCALSVADLRRIVLQRGAENEALEAELKKATAQLIDQAARYSAMVDRWDEALAHVRELEYQIATLKMKATCPVCGKQAGRDGFCFAHDANSPALEDGNGNFMVRCRALAELVHESSPSGEPLRAHFDKMVRELFRTPITPFKKVLHYDITLSASCE
jgi:hypothetical protein